MAELFKDFAFSGTDKDISFSDNDIDFVTGPDECVQNVGIRLDFLYGEQFHQTNIGVPWLTDMVSPQVSISTKEQILRQNILSTPGRKTLDKMTTTVDTDNNVASVDYEGTTESLEFFGGTLNA